MKNTFPVFDFPLFFAIETNLPKHLFSTKGKLQFSIPHK